MVNKDKRFGYAAPEECGIASRSILKMLKKFDDYGFLMHSMLMARGGRIMLETYWSPFTEETHHRMNSITKSFMAIAVGLLIEEGKISLDDKIVSFFPEKVPSDADEYTKSLTVKNLLEMRTSMVRSGVHWVRDGINDRISDYFAVKAQRPADTLFHYDSTGAFILGAIVEKVSGKSLTDYLKDKLLRKLGFSENTDCILGPDGYSWADSGLLCRQRDLLAFASFIKDGGIWQGERLMNEDFLRRAVSKISDSHETGYNSYETEGYGYQIWRFFGGGFAFLGAGDQLMICIPDKDLIFICTADNQEDSKSRAIILDTLYYDIIKEMSDEPLAPDKEGYEELISFADSLELVSVRGDKTNATVGGINGVKYTLDDNPMKIKWLRFQFSDSEGVFEYENETGVKKLPFGLAKNVFTAFPEEGYPDMMMNTPCPGNRFECAVSAAWLEPRKLGLRVQFTGKHLGGMFANFGFTEDLSEIGVYMYKNTRCFMHNYAGYAGGKREK